ncbi:MAG: hypothetical protein IJ880_14470 [Bacilli bacterium]|nr:hypothetical protein [Bacilli bacterium]
MSFNEENKISWDELAPSLQEIINNKASIDDFNLVKAKFDNIEINSGGIRISIVSSLNDISNPVNNKELAIVTTDSVTTVYTYINSNWVKVHAVYA